MAGHMAQEAKPGYRRSKGLSCGRESLGGISYLVQNQYHTIAPLYLCLY